MQIDHTDINALIGYEYTRLCEEETFQIDEMQ